MRVAVLGSNSFAARDFIDLLLSTDRFDILGISRSKEKPASFPSTRHSKERFTHLQFDINSDLENIVPTLLSFEPRYVVNFAAQGDDAASWVHPTDFFQTNCVALAGLVDRLKDITSITRFLQVSSSGVYGNPTSTVTEASRLQPESPYSASKAAADLLLLAYARNFGFPVQIVRPPNLYGRYQPLFRIIPKTIISLKRGMQVELHGGGLATRPYLHVRDASRAMLAVIENGRIGEAYNIGPNELTRIRDIVALICEISGKDFTTNTIDVADRRHQSSTASFDSGKIRHELGWSPEISLRKGIEDIDEWIERERPYLIREELAYTHRR